MSASNTPGDAPPQYVAPGHFYSPVPSVEDIDRAIAAGPSANPLLGIDLREEEQMRLLRDLAKFYPEIPFASDRSTGFRFAFDNPSYSWCDGIILFCMIRELRPRRIIEVGSGHTSCLILDTNELFFSGGIDCTFVEPYPELLLQLLRPEEIGQTKIINQKLQDTDPAIFSSLRQTTFSLSIPATWRKRAAMSRRSSRTSCLHCRPASSCISTTSLPASNTHPSGSGKGEAGTSNICSGLFSSSIRSSGSSCSPDTCFPRIRTSSTSTCQTVFGMQEGIFGWSAQRIITLAKAGEFQLADHFGTK